MFYLQDMLDKYSEIRVEVVNKVKDALVTRKLFDNSAMPTVVDQVASWLKLMVKAVGQNGV